jgi:hypothetical protein
MVAKLYVLLGTENGYHKHGICHLIVDNLNSRWFAVHAFF